MSVGYSTNLQLVEPVTGTESGNWGYDINYGTTDYIDIAIAGTNNITTDLDVTLTQTTGSTSGNNIVGTTAQYAVLNCTGARTAARNIIAPTVSKTYILVNATTGGYAITIKKSGGTGVTIANGETAIVYYNTVSGDFVRVTSLSTSGVVLPANGGTGVANGTNNTITFTGNYTLGLTLSANTAVTLPTSGTLLSTAATVTISQGGTNATATPTAGAVAYGTGTAYAFTAAGTTGQALLSNGSGTPTWGTAGISTGKSIAMAMVFGF
jgi:hypothetical protein